MLRYTRKYYKLSSIIYILLICSACSKKADETLNPETDASIKQLRFTNSFGTVSDAFSSHSRGLAVDADNLTSIGDQAHGVFIYNHPEGTYFEPTSTPNYAFNVASRFNIFYDRWEISLSDARWPEDNSLLSFVTYHPYTDDLGEKSFGSGEEASKFSVLSDADTPGSPRFKYEAGADVANHQDLLVGDNAEGVFGSLINQYNLMGNPSIVFRFEHVSSSIVFSKRVLDADTTDGYKPADNFEFDIVKITVSGLNNEGEFVLDLKENIGDVAYPYTLETPVLWDNLANTKDTKFVLSSGSELQNVADQGYMKLNQVYNITQEEGLMFIPPQVTSDLLTVKVEANISETVTIDKEEDLIVNYYEEEFKLSNYKLEQGKTTNFAITYNYEGPLKGSFKIDGSILPWVTENVTVFPYF